MTMFDTILPNSELDSSSNGFRNQKDDGSSSDDDPNQHATLQQNYVTKRSCSSKTTKTRKVHPETGTVPLEITWNHSIESKKQETVAKRKRTIPKEISFCASFSSSSSVESDLEWEECPKASNMVCGDARERDFHNKCICLELLESERFDDNCVGMEHLVSMANRELVNSSSFLITKNESVLASSIAYSLVFDNYNYTNSNRRSGEFSERLRAVFPSFLGGTEHEYSDTDSTASLSSSSFSSISPSCSSNTTAVSNKRHFQTHETPKASLKLPALRILVSSLELVSRTRRRSRPNPSSSSKSTSSSDSMDMGNSFWRNILAYMAGCLQDLVVLPARGANEEYAGTGAFLRNQNISSPHKYNRHFAKGGSPSHSSCSIEAALVLKAVRLLHKLQPEAMNPYVRNSLLPFVSSALESGFERRRQQQQQQLHQRHPPQHRRSSSADKMLAKECERLLRVFS